MAQDATEVRVAGAGAVYAAPASTALPTNVTALADPWVNLGHVNEDGVAFDFGREVEDLNAWTGSKLRVLTTNEPKTVAFGLMQHNSDVLATAFGGGTVAVASGIATFTPPAKGTNTERTIVIEFVDGDITYRYCLPRCVLEGNVAWSLTKAGAAEFPLTFGVLDNVPTFTIVTDDDNVTEYPAP